MDLSRAQALLSVQSGVVSRSQLTELGLSPPDLERLRRRRDLSPLLPGVFLDHTGPPTWLQRAWAGVLSCHPAALTHESAIRAASGPGWRGHRDDLPVRIAVDHGRRVVEPPGYRVQRTRGLTDRVQWNTSPPRVRLDHAVLDVASEAQDELAVVAVLADVVQARRTSAARLLSTLETRPRLAGRTWIAVVLGDVAAGSCSVLEHRYLTRVERPHGLPRAARQQPAKQDTTTISRDVLYPQFGQVIELDGRLFHDGAGQRDRDMERDLDASIDGLESVRLGWGQVVGRPCLTAAKIGRLLQRRGWTGSPLPCGPGCAVRLAA